MNKAMAAHTTGILCHSALVLLYSGVTLFASAVAYSTPRTTGRVVDMELAGFSHCGELSPGVHLELVALSARRTRDGGSKEAVAGGLGVRWWWCTWWCAWRTECR